MVEVSVTATERAGAIPSPEEVLGYGVGAERKIPDWPIMVDYFTRLAQVSPRVATEELGRTTDDNPLILVTISAPENLARREELRAINARLFDPRGTTPEEAEGLIAEGRSVRSSSAPSTPMSLARR